jgi:glycolate oxidase iron-sulfur subunit
VRAKVQGPLAETAAGATAEAVLRACVHCGMCNATCPTYTLTGDELDGPRGRIYLMKQALEGEPVGRLTQIHLDRCLSCRACETTCPSGVEYHRLYDVARDEVARHVRRPWRERAMRAAIRLVGLRPWLTRPAFIVRGWLRPRIGRTTPAKPPVGAVDRRMTILKGCVQAAAAPDFNAATARVLASIGIGVAPTAGTGCCGALAFHTGAEDEGRAIARRNIDAWSADLDAGALAVVVNASGCAAFIKDYPDVFADDPIYRDAALRIARAVRDPVQVMTADLPATRKTPDHPRVAVHDPCTLRNGLKMEGAVAALLRRLGYDPQPVAETHMCCGSAGAYSLLQPKLSRQLRDRKLAVLTANDPDVIYTANIGCWMHLGGASRTPVRHWIEAVDDLI